MRLVMLALSVIRVFVGVSFSGSRTCSDCDGIVPGFDLPLAGLNLKKSLGLW